jgi:hypothetical protein
MRKRLKLTRENWKQAVAAAIDAFPADLRDKLTSRDWGRDHVGIKVKVPDPAGAQKRVALAIDVRYRRNTCSKDSSDTTPCLEVTNQSDDGRLVRPVGKSTVGDLMKAVQEKINEEMMVGGLITRHHDLHYVRFDGEEVCRDARRP